MSHLHNELLSRLPPHELTRVMVTATRVEFAAGQVSARAGAVLQAVQFPLPGLVVALGGCGLQSGPAFALVGPEGMVGATRRLGVDAVAWPVCVLAGGAAWQLDAGRFDRLLVRCPTLASLAGRHVYALMDQMHALAGCSHVHGVPARLASWLLMADDRWRRPVLALTHEVLAHLLGVRRVSVTLAAGELQRRQLIRTRRGALEVLDRGLLVRAACGCYLRQRQVHAQLFGPA